MQLPLLAPFTGQVVPLEHVKDPAFAKKLVGDGIAIDPTSDTLVAPCAGEVIELVDSLHSVTLRTPEGIEVMLHIGQDTVLLRGRGFSAHVQIGDLVSAGDPLITVDLEQVRQFAASLVTTIIVTNSDRVASFEFATDHVSAGQDTIATLTLTEGSGDDEDAKTVTSERITIPNLLGVHARPASVLVYLARKFDADIRIKHKQRQANAKSVFAIMNLCILHNDDIQLIARGFDAQEAIDAIVPMVYQGLGEDIGRPVVLPPRPAQSPREEAQVPPDTPNVYYGIPASAGIVVGQIFQMRHRPIELRHKRKKRKKELRWLDEAVEKAKGQLEALQARLIANDEVDKAAIFAAHEALLEDPELLDLTVNLILNRGLSAAAAWQSAYSVQADQLASVENPLFASRAEDLRDVGLRVLRNIVGNEPEPLDLPPNAILVSEDLSLSDIASLEDTNVRGFCLTHGGASSHTTIFAHSLDIPAVVGIDPGVLDLDNGSTVILDGTTGHLQIKPSDDEIAQVKTRRQQIAAEQKQDLAQATHPAITTDGQQILVRANVNSLIEAAYANNLGAEGIGLLRSEFMFMEQLTLPDEEEQFELYRSTANAIGSERPLIIRTLDVGGDKPLSYLPIAHEENPFLGERGIRVGLNRPGLLRTQLRAILRAATECNISVMFPMITTLAEWRAIKAMLTQEQQTLGVDPIPAGVMIEVPAAAIMASHFAKEVDFFSIGTNDLTQYTLAMDRGNPKLASKVDGLSPSVLSLIRIVIDAARTHGKDVSLCGALAGDRLAVPLLLGLGLTDLSVPAQSIPRLKAQIRQLNAEACRALAQQALTLATVGEVRDLVSQQAESST